MKHFTVEARTRRFDHESRYGGHGGHSLVKSFEECARDNVPGFDGVSWTVRRPGDERGVAVSQLELDCPTLLATHKGDWKTGAGEVLDHSGLHQLTQHLEYKAKLKSRTKSRRCPGVVDTTYALPAVGHLKDGEVSLFDEPCEDVEIIVSRLEGLRNLRRVPVNCSFCRRGCKRCSKNKGKGGICKGVDESRKAKRAALRWDTLKELAEVNDIDAIVEEVTRRGRQIEFEEMGDLDCMDMVHYEAKNWDPLPAESGDAAQFQAAGMENFEAASESSFVFVDFVDDDACSCDSWACV